MEDTTPMIRQYLEIKKQYPGTLLMFRLGDFYEMFNEDAITGSRELEITLTARQKDSKNPIPMCGVPHHAAAGYIAKLVRKGYRVAICEQAEAAGKGVKLVKREVVRVITPGTAIDSQLSGRGDATWLAAICGENDSFGAAFLELSTGEFAASQVNGPDAWQKVKETVESYGPKELLFPRSSANSVGGEFNPRQNGLLAYESQNSRTGSILLTEQDDDKFDLRDSERLLLEQFKAKELTAFGISNSHEAVRAAGACLRYALFTQKASAEHISAVSYFESKDFMVLDALTLRNLAILQPQGDSGKRTLFNVIDETTTGMGCRLLQSWLTRPSIKRSEIQTRLAAVTELTDSVLRGKIRLLLKEVADLERLVGRLNLGSATARDLNSLCLSISQAPKINAELKDARSLLLQVLSENIFELREVRELISSSISNEPPANIGDGGTIRKGFNKELDELREISSSAKRTIAEFELAERNRSGIGNLKIRFNNVFGYFIEVSKAASVRVPDDYQRRQTLANAERYTTDQLKEWESKVLGADEKIIELEALIFNEIREKVRAETHHLQSTARALATLDALASLAETAAKRNYTAPVLHDGDEIEIKNGRHPIVEAFLASTFIPNDLYLNNSTDRLLVVTGANMGGKSTILRQAALIQILAQIGSFVPASSARLPIVDRIWTRVGASDDLASGRSTFMVEMTETASILHNATPKSLILLDEIGRGTSTFDGLSIAWAVAEYLHNSPTHSAKTIFATHYHELTELADILSGAKNYQISATESDGEVVFLHKLTKGKASKSYGIAVARLAGIPQQVIERAKDVLTRLERFELAVFADDKENGLNEAAARKAVGQMTLFAAANESAVDTIRDSDIEAMSPVDSKKLLMEIKGRLV